MDRAKLDRIHQLIEAKRSTDQELAELIGEAPAEPKQKRPWKRKEVPNGDTGSVETPSVEHNDEGRADA